MSNIISAPLIKRFQVIGLKNYRNVDIHFAKNYKILVGENGLGKTTILDAFYYLLTCKWASLNELIFDFIELEFGNHRLELSQSELDIYVNYLDDHDDYFTIAIIEKLTNFDRIIKSIFENRVVYFPIFRNIHQQLSPLLATKYARNWSAFFKGNLFSEEAEKIINETVMQSDLQDLKNKFQKFKNAPSIEKFKNICNSYLEETRFINSPDHVLEVVNINNNEKVDLKYLSSGEKQIITILSKFYLSNESELVLLIDEPELSLSLTWQKKLLPDIIASKNCSFAFAITHSPFIFDNNLISFAEGLDIYIKKSNA